MEHRDVMKSNMSVFLERKIYKTCVLPAMTYGAGAWPLTGKMENNWEKRILGILYKDGETNSWVRSKTKVKNIRSAKDKIRRWADHVSKMRNNMWMKRITKWTPRHGKRSRGRPNRRWRHELDEYCKTPT